jgi:hypothetical protein
MTGWAGRRPPLAERRIPDDLRIVADTLVADVAPDERRFERDRRALGVPRATPQDRVQGLAVWTPARRVEAVRARLLDLQAEATVGATRVSGQEVGGLFEGVHGTETPGRPII